MNDSESESVLPLALPEDHAPDTPATDTSTIIPIPPVIPEELPVHAASESERPIEPLPVAGQSDLEWLARMESALSGAVEQGFKQGVSEAVQILSESRREAAGELSKAHDEGYMKAVETLMDARDRLAFGIREARRMLRSFIGLRGMLGGREVLNSVLKGQEMSLSYLDDSLRGMNVEPIAHEGGLFEPPGMRAVETLIATRYPPGTILEVVRQGYMRDGKRLRTAEVRIAG